MEKDQKPDPTKIVPPPMNRTGEDDSHRGDLPPPANATPPTNEDDGEAGDGVLTPAPKPNSPDAAESPSTKDAEEVWVGGFFLPTPAINPVVATLIEHGLYDKELGGKRHRLTCPWDKEHRRGDTFDTTYTEPDHANPIGRFDCGHAHEAKRTTADLIDEIGMTPAEARTKPRIRIFPGDSHLAEGAVEQVLAADGTFFHAGGPITRIINPDSQGISTELINDQTLVSILSAKIDWEKKTRDGWIRCDPPPPVVQLVRYGQDRPHLLPLNGLARQPFFGADGKLVTTPGYDVGTGIYADFNSAEYDVSAPDKDRAEHSLTYLKWLLNEFPFASDADRSAALSAILMAAVRPSLPQAPAYSISATRSGSGKSYLANLIALAAGPGDPHNVSYPIKADEATKVVQAMLLERPAVVLFDDMQTDWKSFGALNKALTSPTITERVLGSSRTATARTNVVFLGTGNNIEPEKDMRRRVVSIYLNPPGETPALRTYKNNPVEHARKHRAKVVEAALTIIGAFQAEGSPMAEVRSIGTYGEWSDTCRQPLIWLGEPDPAQSLIDQVSNDSDQELLAEFLDVWWRVFGGQSMSIRKVALEALERSELMDAIAELPVMDGRYINPGRLGWYMKKNRGRRAEGLRIEPGDGSERRTWRVVAEDGRYEPRGKRPPRAY